MSDKESTRSSLVQFLEKKSYVINLLDFDAGKVDYEGLELPAWLASFEEAWLIVPLIDKQGLLGFVVLARPLIVRPINWEDRDLLKTAANQVSSYLAALIVSEEQAMDPFSGSLYLFCNRRRTILKAVYWDLNGFCLWQKRLEKQKFP